MSDDEAQDWRRLLEDLISTMAQATRVIEQSQAILLEYARLRDRELEVREHEAAAARLRAQAELAIGEAQARRRAELEAEAATWHGRLWDTARAGATSAPVQGIIAALTAAAVAAISWWAARWGSPPGGAP